MTVNCHPRLILQPHSVILPVPSLVAGVVCGFRCRCVASATSCLGGGQARPARPERARSPVKLGMTGRKPGKDGAAVTGRAHAAGRGRPLRAAGATRRGTARAGSPAPHRAPRSLPLLSLLWPPPQRPAAADSRLRASLSSRPAPASCRNHPSLSFWRAVSFTGDRARSGRAGHACPPSGQGAT